MSGLYCTPSEVAAIENPAFTPKQIELIRTRTPESEIEIKTDENGLKYKSVKGSYMKKRMNIIFGWNVDFLIMSREYFSHSREVLIHGRLIIRSGKHTVTREQFGKHYLEVKTSNSGGANVTGAVNIGNGYKSAGTDAYKKCCSEIGLCWDIYAPETTEGQKPPQINHQDKVVYDRLNDFLQKCTTIEELDLCFEHFEENTTATQAHKDLKQTHVKRINDGK